MALLGESARVLLQCLTTPCWTEFPDNPSVSSVASATHCASWLRRVYEEVCPLGHKQNCRVVLYSNAQKQLCNTKALV